MIDLIKRNGLKVTFLVLCAVIVGGLGILANFPTADYSHLASFEIGDAETERRIRMLKRKHFAYWAVRGDWRVEYLHPRSDNAVFALSNIEQDRDTYFRTDADELARMYRYIIPVQANSNQSTSCKEAFFENRPVDQKFFDD